MLTAWGGVAADEVTPVTLNVRDFGAIGDGRLHPVSEWDRDRRSPNLRALRKEFPFLKGDDWTIDELACDELRRTQVRPGLGGPGRRVRRRDDGGFDVLGGGP